MKFLLLLFIALGSCLVQANDTLRLYQYELGPGFSEVVTGVQVNRAPPTKKEKIRALKQAKKEFGFKDPEHGKIVLLIDKHVHYIRGIGYGGGYDLVYGYIDTKGDVYLNDLSRSEDIFVFAGIWNYYRGVHKYCSIPSEVEGCYYDEKPMYKDIKKKYGIDAEKIHKSIMTKSKFKKVSL